jgi:hypothetical protein
MGGGIACRHDRVRIGDLTMVGTGGLRLSGKGEARAQETE